MFEEAYLNMSTTCIVVLENGQGVLREGELCPAVGAELLLKDEQGGLNQGAFVARRVGAQPGTGSGPCT